MAFTPASTGAAEKHISTAARAASCKTHACTVRVLSRRCSNSAPRTCVSWVIAARRRSGARAAWLRRIPACESGYNPYATNGHPFNRGPVEVREGISTGLYQFMPATWRTTPYGRRWIFDARAQAQAADWMYGQGRQREWVCS